MTKWLLAAGTCLALLATPAVAQDPHADHAMAMPEGFQTEPVLRTGETRDGDAIRYPTGTAEIVSVLATIEPGGRTPLHEHPVPTFVYILDGEVELETEGGEPRPFQAGQAYIESLDRLHQLFNRGDEPARLLVLFVGEEGTPTTIMPEATQ